jgi:hypothetical protein
MRAGRALIGIHVLAAGILACNLQGGQPSEPDLPGTIPTQILTVLAPTETPASPTPTAVAGVQVSVTSDTNCRTGPAKAFDLIFLAHPGTEFEVVGKNSPTGYWVVNNPTGGTCWLWGEYAVVDGDISNLPEYPSPQLPTPASTQTPAATKTAEATKTPEPPSAAPNAPGDLRERRVCESFTNRQFVPLWRVTFTWAWDDNSSDEDGFRVYLGNSLRETLPKDSNNYSETWEYAKSYAGPYPYKFGVEAYNSAGASARITTDIHLCP